MKKSQSSVVKQMESLRTHIVELVNLPETEAPFISAYLDLLENQDYLRSKLSYWAKTARSTQSLDQRAAFDAAQMDVEEVIRGEWPDEVRSVAVFSRRGTNPFLLVLPFSVSLDLHFTAAGVPAIFPLESPIKGDTSSVLEQAIDKFIEAESDESRDTVTRLNEQIMRRALAVVGVGQSRDAIIGGYAAQLVISEELDESDREDLTRLAAARNLDIEVCEGDDLLALHGGAGCLLRYRPSYLPDEID